MKVTTSRAATKAYKDKAFPGEAIPVEDRHCKEACSNLYHRISWGDRCPAVATSSPKPKITYDRNVVIKGDLFLAMGTHGSRMDDGKLAGKTVYAHV